MLCGFFTGQFGGAGGGASFPTGSEGFVLVDNAGMPSVMPPGGTNSVLVTQLDGAAGLWLPGPPDVGTYFFKVVDGVIGWGAGGGGGGVPAIDPYASGVAVVYWGDGVGLTPRVGVPSGGPAGSDERGVLFTKYAGDLTTPDGAGEVLALGANQLAALDDTGSPIAINVAQATGDVCRDGDVFRVCGTTGNATDGDLTCVHTSYNWTTGLGVGRLGITDVWNFASLASSRNITLAWPSGYAGVLDVRAVFAQATLVRRITRTYRVHKTTGGTLTVTELGSAAGEGDAIAGVNVALASAANVLILTISNATSGATNTSTSVDGDRQILP